MSGQHLYKPSTRAYRDIVARIYIEDPMATAGQGGGLTSIRLPGEPFLGAGPTSGRVEVVDRDASRGVLHAPVQPLRRGGGFAVGGRTPARNFKHHQVNVWATVTRTLNILEAPSVFGRRIPWAFPGGRLRIHPHARREENAYYDRETGALHFCYFDGAAGEIFTCLSHDIVTHELGHAVLDGLKPLYNEVESPDVAGFHEYFGDALAMVSALTLREVLQAVVRDRPRRLGAVNLVSDIALEFGSRGRGHQPLRSAANRRTLRELRANWEEHDYSEVLTGAFYDILCVLYADALPLAQKALKKRRRDGQVAMAALIGAANRACRMMLRALDYCPPAGLTYLDYARAILRADEVAYPVDDRGYRRMVFRVLRDRGILRVRAQGRPEVRLRNDDLREYDVDRLSATKTDAYVFLDANREALLIPRDVNFDVWSLYRTRKVSAGRYYPPREIIIEFGWSEAVPLRGRAYGPLDGQTQRLWCGGTLVFDSDGNVLHYAVKLATPARQRRLHAYLRYLAASGAFDDTLAVQQADGRARLLRKPARRHSRRR